MGIAPEKKMKAPRLIAPVTAASLFFLSFGLNFCIAAHAGSFYGHECSADCDRLQAGYEWARSEGVTAPEGCAGDASFVEGCEIFLENNDAAPDSEPITDQEDYQDSAQGGPDLGGGAETGETPEQGSNPGFAPANTPDDMGNYDDTAPDNDYENYDPDTPDRQYEGMDAAPAAGEEPPAAE
jgi:hypothetical protein